MAFHVAPSRHVAQAWAVAAVLVTAGLEAVFASGVRGAANGGGQAAAGKPSQRQAGSIRCDDSS